MSKENRRPQPRRAVRGSRTGRPIMALLDLLGRRWTLRIIWELHLSAPRPLTFRALQERCQEMSSSVLNQRLGELREARLVASVPGGYTVTRDGAGLIALLAPLDQWAKKWSRNLEQSTRADKAVSPGVITRPRARRS